MINTENLEAKENITLESYSFTYSEQEYKEARNSYFKGNIIRTTAFSLIFIGLAVYLLAAGEPDFIDGLVVGVEAMAVWAMTSVLLRTYKNWNKSLSKICSAVYNFQITDEHLILDVKRDGERVYYNRFELTDLQQKIDAGKYYLVVFANQIYIVKKAELAENSIFHTLKPKEPEKPSATVKALSKALFVLSIVAGVSGVLFIGTHMFNYGAKEWWYLLAFGLIPLISFIFGIYMKKFGKGKGNVIAGLLAFAFVLGIFCAGYSDEFDRPQVIDKIEAVESYIGVDLPEPYAYDNFSDHVDGIYYEDTAMQFYGKDIEWFESSITDIGYWLSDFTDDTYELVKDIGTAEDWDYFIVYNITEDEYNKLPGESGVYSMAAIYYDIDCHGMYVIEYAYVQYEQ